MREEERWLAASKSAERGEMSLTLSISVELIHLALKLGAIILLLACVAALCFICYTYGVQRQLEVLERGKTKE